MPALQFKYNNSEILAEGPFHNLIGAFRRKAVYKDGRMLLTKELDAAFDRKEYKTYFDWFMEKALLLKKIANQYNND